ncbi:MAG TPA: DUF917 family protein [Burkholderiales bacterium]|nr:DUF917 family protein [Burkholderiales bacterium]
MKRRTLSAADLESAILGGLLLSAGGSGMASSARHRKLGEDALERGRVGLVSLEEFEDDDELLVSTAVGAPGAGSARTQPQDAVDAANALVRASGCIPRGVIPGHVPGMYAWTIAAALNIPLADAATNGRAHPTQKMGGMGLASKPEHALWQAGSAAGLSAVVHGDLVRTSNVMRAAAVQNGGLINAVRGPFHAGFVRRQGAPGSIDFCLRLGEVMLAAKAGARVAAAADFLKGSVLVEGEVAENSVAYREGFDIGAMRVGDVTLGVYNEFMTAERRGARLATFPDFLGSLDPATGDPLAISELKPGRRVAIVFCSRNNIPLGAGVFDPAVYPEVEAAMGVELARYVLNERSV